MWVRPLLGFGFVLSLSACATLGQDEVNVPSDEVVSERLAARSLDPGDCGLFVWTADAGRRFILFSQARTLSGDWLSPTGETPLTITQQNGPVTDGQSPFTSFVGPDGEALDLDLQDPRQVINGTTYASGRLKIRSADGWERVQPVVGVSACQVES